MTDFSEVFPEFNDPEVAATLALAERCDKIAQDHAEKYRDERSDVFGKAGTSGDVGVQTRTTYGFTAERIRECDEFGEFGGVLEEEYEISSRVERYELRGQDLPQAIRDEVIRRKLCSPEEIDQPLQMFMLGYFLSIDITSDGGQDSELNVYVGNGQAATYMKQRLVRRAVATAMQDSNRGDKVKGGTDWDMSHFEQLFTAQEASEFNTLAAGLSVNQKMSDSARQFLEEVGALFERLKKDPHTVANEILDELFASREA